MNLDANPLSTNSRVTQAQYFVFSADQQHVGPVTAELIGRGVVAGKLPFDAFVAPVGGGEWVPLGSIPDINLAVSLARTAVNTAASVPAATQMLSALPADAAAFVAATAPVFPAAGAGAGADAGAAAAGAAAAAAAAGAGAAAPAPPPADASAEARAAKDAGRPSPLLPVAIFGAFAFVGAVETALTLLLR